MKKLILVAVIFAGFIGAARVDPRLLVPHRHAPKPYDSKVQYIGSTGVQWIDTGIVIQQGWQVKANFNIVSLAGHASPTAFVMSSGTDWNNGFGIAWDSSASAQGGSIRVNLGSSDNIRSGVMPQTGVRYTVETFADSKAKVQTTTYTPTPGASYPSSLVLFTGRLGGTDYTTMASSVRIFSLQVFNTAGVMVADFYPVRKDGVGYLYDEVSKTLFGNQGSSIFAYGADAN